MSKSRTLPSFCEGNGLRGKWISNKNTLEYLGLGNKLITKFKQRADADNYVEIILRGYVQFEDKD